MSQEREKRKWKQKPVVSLLILFGAVFVILFIAYDFVDYNITMPLSYKGQDEFNLYKTAKLIQEQGGWIFTNERLGAPFGTNCHDFMADSLQAVDTLILKFFTLFTSDPVTAANSAYFFVYFLIAGTSWYALREMGANDAVAVCGALAFDFLYYHEFRSVSHYCLSCYEFVPLSVLLCVWLWRGDVQFFDGGSFFRRKKNWLALLFCLLIANNGIAYYPFFTCLFLAVAGVSGALKKRSLRPVWNMLVTIGSICVFLILALVPTIVYQVQNGGEGPVRSAIDSELYALKVFQMLVPYKNFGMDKLASIQEQYYQAFGQTEAVSSYLGIFAGLGFLILLAVLLFLHRGRFVREDRRGKVLLLLAQLNLAGLLFAVPGGFGSIFSNFVTGLIRGQNRISVFLAFLSVAALCLVMTHCIGLFREQRKNLCRGICILFGVVTVITLMDSIPAGMNEDCAARMQEKQSDEKFIRQIESRLDAGAMVYQLPYQQYPESGSRNQMSDYQLMVGFLYSDMLRWSYGCARGREGDLWNQEMEKLELGERIGKLREQGFAGIYIDRRAYLEQEFAWICNCINVTLGYEPDRSENGNLYFWSL